MNGLEQFENGGKEKVLDLVSVSLFEEAINFQLFGVDPSQASLMPVTI